jgi:hypothetical protein
MENSKLEEMLQQVVEMIHSIDTWQEGVTLFNF